MVLSMRCAGCETARDEGARQSEEDAGQSGHRLGEQHANVNSAHSAQHLPEYAANEFLHVAGTGNQEVPGLDHRDGGL